MFYGLWRQTQPYYTTDKQSGHTVEHNATLESGGAGKSEKIQQG